MSLEQKTLREHVIAVLSDENRHFTKENFCLDREPTAEELLANYERYLIVAHVYGLDVKEATPDLQYPLFV